MSLSKRVRGIPASGIREIFDMGQSVPDLVSLGIGEPNFRTPDFINKVAKEAIDEGFDKYTVNKGIPELRKSIARKLKRENQIDTDPETEIIVTSGGTQAIFYSINCILDDGDEMLTPSPMFPSYDVAARLAGAKTVEIPLDESEGFRIDFEKLKATKKTKLLVLNSPCNPTGVVRTEKEIKKLIEFVLENNLYILSDEIYEKYLYEQATHFSPASNDEVKSRVITLNGFSKTYAMPGWRLGYAVANEEIISGMTKLTMYDSVCANSITQRAGIAALDGGMDFFEPVLRRYIKMRNLMCAYLDEMSIPFVRPSGSFYIFPNISDISKDSVYYCKELLSKEHVATIPGLSFGVEGESHIRLSYSTSEESLVEGMERVKRFNKKFRPRI